MAENTKGLIICGHANATMRDYLVCTNTHLVKYQGCSFCRMPWSKVTKIQKLSKKFIAEREAKIQRFKESNYVPTGNAWGSESVQTDTDS